MNDNEKIQIAKNYVEAHKNSKIDKWAINCSKYTYKHDEKYLDVYSNLAEEVYSEITQIDEDYYETEISSLESKTGKAVLFRFSLYYDF